MKCILFLLAFNLLALNSNCQDAKHPNDSFNVIIDTDCGIDDLWAISILLSRPEVKIEAIIASEGCLSPANGALKIQSLLHFFGKDNIPVAIGLANPSINPSWRGFCNKISWGDEVSKRDFISIYQLFSAMNLDADKFTMLCLGSLTSAKILSKNFNFLNKKVNRIIWYNTSINPPSGFNYSCDTVAATEIINNGNIRIDVVRNPLNMVLADSLLLGLSQNLVGKLPQFINYLQKQPVMKNNLTHKGKTAADELVAIYLLAPELFITDLKVTQPKLRWITSFDPQIVKEIFSDIVKGTYTNKRSIVFNEFPDKKELFNYDVRQIIDSAISKHGYDEWKACVITDEFHGHLGVFSIVGAKMGIKARELFGVGPDQLSVLSFAGSKPPYSCLSDGIQVSTGATLGQGLIQISPDSITQPSAIFSFGGKSVRITLKSEYLKIVNDDIAEGIVKYGLTDDGYWKLVRQSALNYWLHWSRNKIFDIEWLNNN